EARNVKRGGELMWMDLLMVDVKSTVMQVTISAGRLPQFNNSNDYSTTPVPFL
ncbi:unnamed protein product, partial [Brassica rapa]